MVVPQTGYYRVLQAYTAERMSRVGLGLGWGFADPLHDLRVYCEERECIVNLNK